VTRASHLLRRALASLVTVYVVVTLNFLLFRVLPGDAIANMSHVPGSSEAMRDALRKQFGLNDSLWTQYWLYLDQLLHGHLGISYANQQPVGHRLVVAFGNTLVIVAAGMVIALVLGVLTGMLSAWFRGTWVDRVSTATAIGFYSVPTHVLGLLLVLWFGTRLPTQGMTDEFAIDSSFAQRLADVGQHMILPSVTIGLIMFGQYTLVVRSTMLETLGDDHVLTARALGAKPARILRKHVLPNAMLPLTTLTALSLGGLIGGTILVETVFSWPGVGRAMYDAVIERDYPMLQGVFLFLTVIVVLLNLVADVIAVRLDPRVAAE